MDLQSSVRWSGFAIQTEESADLQSANHNNPNIFDNNVISLREKAQLLFRLVNFFEVDIKKFKIPKSLYADINNPANAEDKSKEKEQIFIPLTIYQLNKRIPDTMF